jgi:hypothetical protein
VARVANSLPAQGKHLRDFRNALVVGQPEQGLDTPDHSQIATTRGLLKPAIEWLACTEVEV